MEARRDNEEPEKWALVTSAFRLEALAEVARGIDPCPGAPSQAHPSAKTATPEGPKAMAPATSSVTTGLSPEVLRSHLSPCEVGRGELRCESHVAEFPTPPENSMALMSRSM